MPGIQANEFAIYFLLAGLFMGIFFSCDGVMIDREDTQQEWVVSDSLLNMAERKASSHADLSEEYLRQVSTTIDLLSEQVLLGKYHLVKGRVLYYRDAFAPSIAHIDTAIILFKSLNDQPSLAKAYSYLAPAQALMGNYPSAIQTSLKSIDLFKQIRDYMSLASTLNYLANIYIEQGDYEKAQEYAGSAFELSVKDSLSLLHASVLSTQGRIFSLSGDLELAECSHANAFMIRKQCADLRHMASSMQNLAELFYMQGKYDLSLKHLTDAETIYHQLNEKTGLFNVYLTYSQVYAASNMSGKDLHYAAMALGIAKEVESLRHLSKAYEILADIYSQRGDSEHALTSYRQFMSFHNQLISLEKNRLISNFEYHQDLLNTTKDNEILLQKNKIRDQQTIILSIILGVVFILLFSGFVFFRHRNKAMKDKQVLLEKKRAMAEARLELQTKEKIILENSLEFKNKELTSKTLELLHQVEILQSLAKKIENLKHSGSRKEVEEILHELNMKTRENVWDEFHQAFNSVHNDFYERLLVISPDLTSAEIKIAALLKLNLCTKEIAAISYKSESAVKTARHRLRQKLNLGSDDNLINFLMRI